MDEKTPDEFLKNLPVQAENIAFSPNEMIACNKCGRTNPPTRLNCFYCSQQLEISLEQSQFLKPSLRKLEAWEKGFNLIFIPAAQNFDKPNATEVSKLLKLDAEIILKIFAAEVALPLARTESEKEAEIVQTRLRDLGVETQIVSDEILALETPTRRLRRIDFYDDSLIFIFFNRDEIVKIPYEDVALIIAGAVFERKIQATETYNKKGENQILDSTETASDEMLIDIYSREDSIGYRVWTKGFDFSCLGRQKKMLARENIKMLADNMRQHCANAKFVDDYLHVRGTLSEVWEVEQKTDSQGLQRKGFGKINLSNMTTINNLSQFTKYSRLQWQLL